MSFEERAYAVLEKITELKDECFRIEDAIAKGTMKLDFNDESIEFNAEQKQKIIAFYENRKAVLERLVSELP